VKAVVVFEAGWAVKMLASAVDIAALAGLAVLVVERRVVENDGRLFASAGYTG
jgi:hypothetical protein